MVPPEIGSGGDVKTPFGANIEYASGVLVQADGKIVLSGSTFGSPNQVAIARYNADGTLDTTFSGDGKLTNPNTTWGYRVAVAAGPGGKLLVSGTNGDFAVMRYNVDGTIDTSFGGGDGTASLDLGGLDYAYTLTVQSDGRVVAAGLSLRSGGQYTIGIARFLADGTTDTSFDTDGGRTTTSPGRTRSPTTWPWPTTGE